MRTYLSHPATTADVDEHELIAALDDPALLRINLLAEFRVSAGTEPPLDWRSRKAAQIVKLLALAPDHALHREQLFERLWPECTPDVAANNLRRTLHVARRLLRTLPLDPAPILQTQGGRVHLYPSERLWIDVDAFTAAARAARNAVDPDVYWAAIECYSGPLLPDELYSDWAVSGRETLEATYLALLDDVAQLHEVRGEYSQALAALRRLIEAEPLHEAACVRTMRLYALTGRRTLALRQYEQLRQSLEQGLDVTPEPATQALYIAIKDGQFPVPTPKESGRLMPAFAPQRPSTNLPHALSCFIGRERDVADVIELLQNHRLVTLTGLGGIGKTRLALEVAWKGCEAYPDGVWLIELAALTDPALLPQTIAGTFGIQAEGARAPVDTLVTTLRDAALLLVLDNCEHLITACAGLVEILLDACPNLHILATSREALRLSGEFPWLVPSLPLPDPDAGLIELAENDAVRLFVDRIRWHQPGFALTQENAGVAGAICRQLGGLPLALELAAARAAFLALPQLADRLSDALDVLAGGSRSAPTRQQTLRATLDWSYTLLGESEQTIFRRLAVFAGGWTLVEAESICASGQLAKHEILDLLGNLVAKSLVQVDLTRDEARYRLLEPVRQYAMSLLEASGEANSVRERHALYLLTFLEEIEPELSGPHQADWFSHLDREHDNLRAALRWALEQGEAETALRM
ncbi:MAG TPA: BTAD domain-containing putative transcriptional regulator, partial [Planctomycetaceae bacterium]|nr:BTAD domain-containing putative transcriptional regulator [Planctomycetaceae bacterium]